MVELIIVGAVAFGVGGVAGMIYGGRNESKLEDTILSLYDDLRDARNRVAPTKRPASWKQ